MDNKDYKYCMSSKHHCVFIEIVAQSAIDKIRSALFSKTPHEVDTYLADLHEYLDKMSNNEEIIELEQRARERAEKAREMI